MRIRTIAGLIFVALFICQSASASSNDQSPDSATAVPVPEAQLKISPVSKEPDALSSLTVTDLKSKATFKVYFDNTSERIARQSVPTLAAFYRQVAALVVIDPADVDWHAVVFARNAESLILTRKPGESVWRVDVGGDGQLSTDGIKTLYITMPHEQTHATQNVWQDATGLPRWFDEGQASWVELQVVALWKPALAKEQREKLASALKDAKQPVALAQWGGVHPKPEAILRQLTPEQRAQFLKNPSSIQLSRAFAFKDGDFVSDESNTLARYGASLALFERIDKQAGRDALIAWFVAVQRAGKHISSKELATLSLEHTKIDITADLE